MTERGCSYSDCSRCHVQCWHDPCDLPVTHDGPHSWEVNATQGDDGLRETITKLVKQGRRDDTISPGLSETLLGLVNGR